MKTGLFMSAWVAVSLLFLSLAQARADVPQFYDDFSGPTLSSVWQTNLPNNAYSGSFPFGYAQPATYLGAPQYGFETLGTNSVLRMTFHMPAGTVSARCC